MNMRNLVKSLMFEVQQQNITLTTLVETLSKIVNVEISWVSQLLLGRKPCCSSHRTLWDSKWSFIYHHLSHHYTETCVITIIINCIFSQVPSGIVNKEIIVSVEWNNTSAMDGHMMGHQVMPSTYYSFTRSRDLAVSLLMLVTFGRKI